MVFMDCDSDAWMICVFIVALIPTEFPDFLGGLSKISVLVISYLVEVIGREPVKILTTFLW